MARQLSEHLDPTAGPKRVLALDGGGVKGVLSLGMAKALESELRRRSGDPRLVLSDYYDLIGGTSTGAIVATGLALGLPVDAMIELYMSLGPKVFGRRVGDGSLFRSKYDPRDLRVALEPTLGDRTLDSLDLRTGLAIHMKRIDTGSAWVLTNNPKNPFFNADDDEKGTLPNRRYRLIDLVMASAAAPTFFDESSSTSPTTTRTASSRRAISSTARWVRTTTPACNCSCSRWCPATASSGRAAPTT